MKIQFTKTYKSKKALYEIVNELGRGGNGIVYRVKCEENYYALKLLKNRKQRDSLARFIDEIKILKRLRSVNGVVPMLDYHISRDKGTLFYVMPIAEMLTHYVLKEDKSNVVVLFWELAITLKNLCKRGIHHRDIKPTNIFYYDDSVCISDFGLVEFPDKKDITPLKGKLGPERTMAPEMRRSPGSSEGEKADVYSFAKTFYILLTGNEDCFDGKYDSLGSAHISRYCTFDSMQIIEGLMELCTEHDPEKRPTFEGIILYFELWHNSCHNISKQSEYVWKFYQKKLFAYGAPEKAQWNNLGDILNILKVVARTSHMNHVLLPGGGGLDLLDASIGDEPNTLDLNFQSSFVLHPKKLYYESYKNHPNDNYFFLELNELSPISGETVLHSERLTCISPLNYAPSRCWDYNDFNGEDLPEGSRLVTRLLRGKLLFLSKTSLYNSYPKTYDGRHVMMTNEQLKTMIEKMYQIKLKIQNKQEINNSADANCTVCSYTYPKKFKLKRRLLKNDEISLVSKFISFLANIPELDSTASEYSGDIDTGMDYDTIVQYHNLKTHVVNYLNQMERADLILIAAVMLGGRDYTGGDFGDPLDLIIETTSENSHGLAEYVASKTPSLINYLKNGIKLYS